MTSNYSNMSRKKHFKCRYQIYLYTRDNTSGSPLTPTGVDGKVDSNRMPDSHTESAVSITELEAADTG